MRTAFWIQTVAWAALLAPPASVAAPDAAELEFFEREIRPLFADNCHACHSADAPVVFANLRLDTRAGLLAGSDAGPVVEPGAPEASKLLAALRGEIAQMPPTGKLPDDRIEAVARWIEMGAPWPDEPAPAADPPASDVFDLEARRQAHWAWRPIADPAPPAVDEPAWPSGPIDRFILAKLESEGLQPGGDAERTDFIRRASFDLVGLPPSPDEVRAFLDDRDPGAHDRLIDRLLESPRFGEHWARRWMDLMRYAESHGSEGDPDIPQAWRYRDYLIRAFNADVPYDQLVREHLAGDLLEDPRIDPDRKVNESLLGSAHWRLVEHGFQPVDPWEDRVKWTDNQIDVVSKTFLGLTVSCARCHDHKFDAISQKDYYALFGSIKGARPTQRAIDAPALLEKNRDELEGLKREVRSKLAAAWLSAAERDEWLDQAGERQWEHNGPLHAWALLRDLDGEELRAGWRALADYWRTEIEARRRFNNDGFDWKWDLSRPRDFTKWMGHGEGLPSSPAQPGDFEVPPAGPRAISGIYGAGVFSNLLSRKHGAVLQSPRFTIDSDYISFRVQGGNFSVVRLMIENYAVPRGGIYHLRYSPKKDEPAWVTWKTEYWKGFSAYIEYATLDDATNFLLDPIDQQAKPRPQPVRDGRSWFGAGKVVFHDAERTPRETLEPIAYLFGDEAPRSADELEALLRRRLETAIESWRDGAMTEPQAVFLDHFVRGALLPVTVGELEEVAPLIKRYRELEEEIPVPRRAPGVIEEGGEPQRLLIRGSHKNLGEPVERRLLTALGGDPCGDPKRARLHLAREIASPENPLTARVAVNRLWAPLFGRGLVATVDNFGKLGKTPSHPELLDWLASRFIEDGWSIKKTLKRLATSRAYRMSSDVSPRAREADPDNRLLSHMPVRRLRAEQIRDSLLAISGRLKPEMHGPSVPVYYAYAKGKTKGDQEKGPLDGDGRRSVYLEIRRNTHNPFLEAFDLPKPSTTRGTRDVTNVPAQSLTLLNSPFVIGQAEAWAEALVDDGRSDPAQRIKHMFWKAFARAPDASELDRSLTYLDELARAHGVAEDERMTARRPWQDFAQALFNLKELIYVR